MKNTLQNISIYGVGLIGGSLAAALKKKGGYRVTGYFHRRGNAVTARRRGLVDYATMDKRAATRDADIVLIATGAFDARGIAREIVPFMRRGAILTDAVSTKGALVADLEKIAAPHGVKVVGGHPFAGSHESGVASARPDLFEKAVCVLTPTPGTDKKALRIVKKIWRDAGMRVVLTTPAKHDALLGATSHLPHLVAAALTASLTEKAADFVGRGFCDTTRIAQGKADVWAGIFMENKNEIVRALRRFEDVLAEIEKRVSDGDAAGLVRLLDRAARRRQRIERKVRWISDWK